MKKNSRIAVLGAGVMGCSTAIFLARKGFQVSIFDKEKQPFSAASRWNEGKIHLGFIIVQIHLYAPQIMSFLEGSIFAL